MQVERVLEDVPHDVLTGLLGVVYKHGPVHHQVERVDPRQPLSQIVGIY